MSAAEALRRCPEVVFVRPRHSALPRSTRAPCGPAIEEVVPRVERTGHRRGVPRPRHASIDSFAGARRLAEAVQVAVRGATSLSCSLGRLDVEGRLQGRLRPPQAGRDHRRAAGREARFLAPLADADPPGRRAARRGAARRGRRRHDRRARRARPTPSSAPCCPARSGACCATAPAASTPRPRARRGADLDLDRGDVRARPHRPGGAPRGAAAHGGGRGRRTSGATGSPPGR